ncbi:hypothetical protein ATU3B_24550 [Agrobacterium genomosp. 3 str. CIP 111-78]|uniref:Uncharacterized protein n=1 Tax=Agrobacterium tumefaciens TaxID=358 RepID=A0AAE6EK69_AGRTU|nr:MULTISPECIES: hypothetical protein [Agrobacterium tumefaciens complex]MCA2374801.1 hypothetical protein [Agrobacterium tomkonis CIP 111-78]QCM00215.1 hypothetical protein CFBP6624_08725 [Agrobacterium tumefaciens]
MSWQVRLTKEKTLFDVYKQARLVASTRSNFIVAMSSALLVFALTTINMHFFPQFDHRVSLATGVRVVAETGFSFTSTLLGFLISGFAIFASITKPEVFVVLAQIPHKKGDMSRLHFIFFNFLFVFIHYLIFLGICIIIKTVGYPRGPLSEILAVLYYEIPQHASLVTGIIFSGMVGYTAFLIVLLKSFIWNMYQAILITIGANDILKEIERASGHHGQV